MKETTNKIGTYIELNEKYRKEIDNEIKHNKKLKRKPNNVREVIEDSLRVRYF